MQGGFRVGRNLVKFKSKAGDVLPEGTAKVADDVADAKKRMQRRSGRWQSSKADC